MRQPVVSYITQITVGHCSQGSILTSGMEGDPILDLTIEYALNGCYGDELSKDKKRAVRKRAARLVGEVYYSGKK